MRYLISMLLISGCTLNLQIDNEFAAQRGDGVITEQTTSEAKTENKTDVAADLGGAL